MTESRRSFLSGWTRAGLAGLASGLMLLASGDGARTAGAPGGIDPLDILKLQVRPNVVLMMDSSGSMRESVGGNTFSGDYNMSKVSQAKQVLATLVRNNQDRVSFMFGKYTQPTVTPTPVPPPPASLLDAMTFPNAANRFMYVTADPNAASMQINPFGSGTSAGRLKRSSTADNQGDFSPTGTPMTFYKAFAGRFFNGQRVFFSNTPATGTFCNVGATVGPPGTTASAGSNVGPVDPVTGLPTSAPYVELQRKNACADADNAAVGPVVKFVFSGLSSASNWGAATVANTCPGFFPIISLATCNDVLQIDTVENPYLFSEFDILPDGTLAGYQEDPTTFALLAPPNHNGIRGAGNTPIANSLMDVKTIWDQLWTAGLPGPPVVPPISGQTPVKQRTFFVIVTDGDDTCASTTTGNSGAIDTDNERALRAAYRAELLYRPIVPTDAASGVPTFIVAFGNGVTPARANWEAWGGSGMSLPTIDTGTLTRWGNSPTAAQRAACTTCQDAFIATSAQALADALQGVIDQTLAQGEFSAAQSLIGTVFELTVDDPATTVVENAFDPNTRYNQRVNILYQSTFELPGWRGTLSAFRNDGTFLSVGAVNSLGVWDAGQTLNDQITIPMQTATRGGRPPDQFTFAELHDGQSVATIANSAALIKRRIFTSNGNGSFTRAANGTGPYDAQFDASTPTGTNVVALWPPNQTGLTSAITDIDPPVGTTGPFDAAFGLTTMTFADLQTFFGACEASTDVGSGPLPAGCNFAGNPTLATETALKEAREILLAFMAGAGIALGTDGLTLREATSSALLFGDRGWLLADTQLSAPAIVSPPLKFPPSAHAAEFILYRDGLRDPATALGINDLDRGFGLRNPDGDDPNPAANLNLKPVMTVVYFGANDMLHAFRAGPCLSAMCTEQGSEELWAFVPFDQLGKQKDLLGGQRTTPHTYVVASSIRVADVFIPDADGYTFSGRNFAGRWRTVLVFGRGPGGKYYTALDVTSPGQFTRPALQTNPPWIMWNRGNPDTVDGTPTGTPVNAVDTAAYSKMGETWSVPAIGNVDPNLGFEWRVFTGSGYGDPQNPGEGATFYQLDAVTGNIVQSRALPGGDPSFTLDPSSSPPPAAGADGNALVAGPAAYNPRAQDPPGTSVHDPIDRVTRVFIPDIQGRIWKFTMASSDIFFDAGPSQPIANPVALLKIDNKAHVYAESGNDDRVPDFAGPFNIYGLRDDGSDTVNTPATVLFASPFPLPTGAGLSSVLFRGTAQPATAFNASGLGRVFFLGTRFNPTGATSCISSFDSIFIGVGAQTGGAAYDWSGSPYYVMTGDKGQGLQPVGGGVQISKSVHPSPSPPASPTPTPPAPKPAFILTIAQRSGSPVCRTP